MKNEDGTKTVYDLSIEFIDLVNEETKEVESKSKFLYMVDFLSSWPSEVIDVLFDAFSDMVAEAREKVKKNAKFERFKISEKPAEDKAETLKRSQRQRNPLKGSMITRGWQRRWSGSSKKLIRPFTKLRIKRRPSNVSGRCLS